MTTPDERALTLAWTLVDKMLELGPVSRVRLRKGSGEGTWYLVYKWLGSNYQVQVDWPEGQLFLDWGIGRVSVQLTEGGCRVGEKTVRYTEDAAVLMIEKMGQRA